LTVAVFHTVNATQLPQLDPSPQWDSVRVTGKIFHLTFFSDTTQMSFLLLFCEKNLIQIATWRRHNNCQIAQLTELLSRMWRSRQL